MLRSRSIRICISLMCFIIALTIIPFASGNGSADAASKSTKKMTVYDQVLKSGNNVYCLVNDGIDGYLYKINLKNSKVKKIKGNILKPSGMIIKKDRLYYVSGSTDIPVADLLAYNIKNGKIKELAHIESEDHGPIYVISNNKILYKEAYLTDNDDLYKTKYRQMNLDGSGKKALKNTRLKVKCKNSNAKGYKLVYAGKGKHTEDDYTYYDYYKCYLQKPDGSRIYIRKVTDYWE